MLRAIKFLQKRKSKLKGKVRFIFKNTEGTSTSVKVMIKDGALENPNIDFILAVHVS
jgi:amidohydrolase